MHGIAPKIVLLLTVFAGFFEALVLTLNVIFFEIRKFNKRLKHTQ